MQGRNRQVVRIVKIISWIESSRFGMTVKEIVGRLDGLGIKVSSRTVYRDISAISEAGFPLEEVPASSGHGDRVVKWRIAKGTGLGNRARLNSRELLALFFVKASYEKAIDVRFKSQFEIALKTIEEHLTLPEWEYYRELGKIFQFETDSPIRADFNLPLFEMLVQCCLEGESTEYSISTQEGEVVYGYAKRILFQVDSVSLVIELDSKQDWVIPMNSIAEISSKCD